VPPRQSVWFLEKLTGKFAHGMRRRTHVPSALLVRKISRDKIHGPWVRGLGFGLKLGVMPLGLWPWGNGAFDKI
jgi:hypothetical protein